MIAHLADLLPWWVYAVFLGVVVLVVGRIFGLRWALGAAALVVAALFYRKGRDDGRKVVEDEEKDARIEAIGKRKESDDEVDRMGGTQRDAEWGKWLRDK